MIKELMSTRRFAPLFWAQFFSALNDNVLKNALVIILLYGAATSHGDALVTVAGAVFIFPFFILSGFSFPISSMPQVLQWLTYVNPLRYYLVVIRGTFLKGVGLSVLWPELAAMAAIALMLLATSILRFRKSLE